MEEKIYTAEIAGHCNEPTAWRILKEMTESFMRHGLSPIHPYCIVIEDDGSFSLAHVKVQACHEGFNPPEYTEQSVNEASIVWSLGATVFFLVTGRQVMNGKGGKGQQRSSKLPYLRSEWPELSELVQQCLHYEPKRRPTLVEINEKAREQYDRCLKEIKHGPKFKDNINSSQGNHSLEDKDLSFWPETMQSNPTNH